MGLRVACEKEEDMKRTRRSRCVGGVGGEGERRKEIRPRRGQAAKPNMNGLCLADSPHPYPQQQEQQQKQQRREALQWQRRQQQQSKEAA